MRVLALSLLILPMMFGAAQAQTDDPHHRANKEGSKREGEQAMSDGGGAWRFSPGALLIDVDPLLVAGRLRELVDPLLRHLDPVADADLGLERRLISSKPENIRMVVA